MASGQSVPNCDDVPRTFAFQNFYSESVRESYLDAFFEGRCTKIEVSKSPYSYVLADRRSRNLTGGVYGGVMDKSAATISGATVTIENADKASRSSRTKSHIGSF